MKWLIVIADGVDEDGLVHVVPDTDDHSLSDKCVCEPTPRYGEFSVIMVHHLPN